MINGKAVSVALFAGAFGLHLGLEQAGFHTVSIVEKDPDAVKTIALNRPHLREIAVPNIIENVNALDVLTDGGQMLGLGRALYPGEVDLVAGGSPCQPFSTSGRRGSIQDPRGNLFKDYIRIVKGVQPRFCLLENVRGLLSAPVRHRPHRKRGKGFHPLEQDEVSGTALTMMLAEMESIGYTVIYKLLDAADYGVPQNRKRVIVLGSRDREALSFPQATHSKDGHKLTKWRNLRDALTEFVDESPEFVPYSENRLKYLRLLIQGQNWRHLPDELKSKAMGGAYQAGGGKAGFYRRLSWDKPSPTITTSPYQKATDMCHPVELRPLSVRECARIQTFPDNWIFYGSCTSKYRQIGNAVPVLLAKAIGESIYNAL